MTSGHELDGPLKEQSSGRLVVPSLVLSRIAIQPLTLITILLLIEIGKTFGTPVGVTGQLSSLSSIMAVLSGLLMGFLAIRFNYKSLLLTGLLFYGLSAFGCYLSPNFAVLLLMYALSGIGRAMVMPMSGALVGSILPLEKRAGAISWFFTGVSIAVFIGAPVISFIAGFGGWRTSFLLLALPIVLGALLLVFFGIPSGADTPRPSSGGGEYIGRFKSIFSNRSALACLLCALLTNVTWSVTPTFAITFLRETFSMPRAQASLLLMGTSTCFAIGSLSGGYFVNKLGRKKVAIISTFFIGLLLVLEQVPELRGTMMSMNSTATNIGSAIGAGFGGFLLLSFDYGVLGILGLFSIISAIVYYFFAVDPTRIDSQHQNLSS